MSHDESLARTLDERRAARMEGVSADEHMALIDATRLAIVRELKRRFIAGDKNVLPRDPQLAPRWGVSENYYSGQGAMTCPVCAIGILQYKRSSKNGHVHAHCSTARCVSWME